MRQVVCKGVGDVSVMRLQDDAPVPEPTAGQVRIRVAAAGVNRPDLLQRQGLYPPPPDASPHLGLEVSGTVDVCGQGVTGYKAGDAACALVAGGGYAEFVCVPQSMLMRVPEGLSLQEAAALPETCMTVWANVFERCALAPGEVFLVHAGASSIGLTAISMARATGAVVLATVSSAEKARACESAGAHAVFLYGSPGTATADFAQMAENGASGQRAGDATGWVAEVSAWLKKAGLNGVDVLLDMLGGPMLAATVPLLAAEGRVASIAQLGGAKVELDLMRIMLKRITVTGSTLRARTPQYKAHLAEVLQQRVWPQIERGDWKPVIHSVLPAAHVQKAHGLLEHRSNIGKVLLIF